VSVKIFQPKRTSALSIEQRKKFQREVLLLSKFRHENIVRVILEPLMFCLFSYVSSLISLVVDGIISLMGSF